MVSYTCGFGTQPRHGRSSVPYCHQGDTPQLPDDVSALPCLSLAGTQERADADAW
jgi:hypothetical protein